LIEPETANTETAERRESQTSLKQLALLFFMLGVISFGGPAAYIAMMEDEVVRRRRWLSRDEFLDLLGATNLIPGPNSTEMAIHIGRRPAGAVLDGINAASMSLMVVVTWRLGWAALVDWTTAAMLVVSLILLIRFRINSAWLVLARALFGLVLSTVRGA
jgi:chromate transporter